MRWPAKPQDLTVAYGIDLTGWLAGASIARAGAQVVESTAPPGALQIVRSSQADGLVAVWLAGGLAEHDHAVRLTVRSTAGKEIDLPIWLLVVAGPVAGCPAPPEPGGHGNDLAVARRTAELAEDVLRQTLATGLAPAGPLDGTEGLLISQMADGQRRPREARLSILLTATRTPIYLRADTTLSWATHEEAELRCVTAGIRITAPSPLTFPENAGVPIFALGGTTVPILSDHAIIKAGGSSAVGSGSMAWLVACHGVPEIAGGAPCWLLRGGVA